MESGGWESRESVTAFEHYAKSAFFPAFGDLVTHCSYFQRAHGSY